MTTDGRESSAIAKRRRLGELLAHAWDRSSFYRELYSAHGIRRPDLPHVALEDLPIVPSKADLMLRFDEAVTDPRLRKGDLEQWMQQDANPLNLYLDEYIIIHSTSPTKSHGLVPGYIPYTREAWRYMTTTVAPLLLPLGQGIDAPLRSAFFFTTEGHYAGSTSTGLASHSAHELLRLSVFDPVEEIRARLNAFQPERLHSYASALTWLAEWTLQGKLRIAPRSVLVTGDRLSPAMRAKVQEAWDAEIYDLYATSESLYMAVRRPGEAEFQVFTDLALLEVVDSANRMVQPGTRGRVLLTDLSNTTLPFIRYDLHDYAIPGRVGLGAETLGALDGKADEALPVRLADGSLGALEIYEIAELELPGVEKIQLVSHSPVEVEIRYQSAHDLGARIDAAFRRLLAQKSATVEKLAIRRVERVLNDWQTYKLRRVVEPDRRMLTPRFRSEDDGRSTAPVSPTVVPTASVQPSAQTRLPGGTVDRSDLPQQTPAAAPSAGDREYASATEAALAYIWREVLNVPAVARGEDFFDLGGDSIGVFRVIAQIKKCFGVDLTVREFFAHSVLAELARAIDARRTG